MHDKAKLFMNGRSQAVRLPDAYRFESQEVFISRDPETGDVILSTRPKTWDNFFRALDLEQDDVDLSEGRQQNPSAERDFS